MAFEMRFKCGFLKIWLVRCAENNRQLTANNAINNN